MAHNTDLIRQRKRKRLSLIKFSNGCLKATGKTGLKYSSYIKDDSSDVPKRLIIASSSRLTYSGTNLENDVPKISSTVLKVCVVNKKDSSVNFYDADLFHLKPFINCPEAKQTQEKSFLERSADLTLEFGSKKKKKQISTKLIYGSGSGTSSDLNSIGSNLTMGNFDAVEQQKEDSPTLLIIPPQNKSAVNVDQVYNIFDIISAEEYAILDSKAEIFLSAKIEDIQLWKEENRYSNFIIEYMQNNIHSLDLHKAKLLCYIHYMFCFLKTVFADWRKKDPVPDVPEPFKQKLMDAFTIKRSMPQRMKDKLLAHAIVIGLALNNYILNSKAFTSSTKISSIRMQSIAYVLGCHVSGSKSDNQRIIHLKLPLYKHKPFEKLKKK